MPPTQDGQAAEEIAREDLELNLKAVRVLAGKTQVDVAETAGTSQGRDLDHRATERPPGLDRRGRDKPRPTDSLVARCGRP